MNATGFWFYALGYLLQVPTYTCVFSKPVSDPAAECTTENICDNSSGLIVSYSIDWSSNRSLDNWWERFDLLCVPPWKYELIGSMVFIGWVATLLWVPPFADKYGRKKLFYLGMVIDLIVFLALYVNKSLDVMIGLAFIFGAACTLRVNIGFVYMQEMLPKKNQTFFGTLYNIQESAMAMMAAIYFSQCKQWQYFVLIGVII
jgi:MFS family permease